MVAYLGITPRHKGWSGHFEQTHGVRGTQRGPSVSVSTVVLDGHDSKLGFRVLIVNYSW